MSGVARNIYRVGAVCPHCGEEHGCWVIRLSDEEQVAMDDFYATHRGGTDFSMALEAISDGSAPLVVERTLRCPVCREVFTGTVGIFRTDRICR